MKMLPALRIVEARNETDDGGLAGPGRADQRRRLAALGNETDAAQDCLVAIGEVNVAKLDAGLGDGERLGVRQVALTRLHIEQFVDHARIDDGAFHLHLQLGKAAGRIIGQAAAR